MFSSLLTGLSSKQVQVIGHVTLETTCVEGADAKEIDIRYLIVDVVLSYNTIIW